MWAITALQNQSVWSGVEPTVVISKGEEGWAEAYSKWKSGSNPTDSKEWKLGVYAIFGPGVSDVTNS